MDMSVQRAGSFWQRLLSREGYTSVSHVFVMEWAAILRDLVGGLLIAGAIAAWVPESFWRNFFLTDHPLLSKIWGPLVGPIVAMLSFVCSIGNVPLAAVLWNGGISFGGVVSFIFADLIILPIINIYRKYYGWRTALYLTGTFYASMVAAGYVIEILFGVTGLVPSQRQAKVMQAGITWNYTTWLNIAFLILAAALVLRFLRTGGLDMLRMMGGSPDQDHAGHAGGHHDASHNHQGPGHEDQHRQDHWRAMPAPRAQAGPSDGRPGWRTGSRPAPGVASPTHANKRPAVA
jgi:uncharacterized membrane protein YraQ (UPF0718 family)